MKNKLFLWIVLLALASCKPSNEHKDTFALEATNHYATYLLNDDVSLKIKALFLFSDEKNNEYLTFQNNLKPEIYIYKSQTGEFIKKIAFETEGKNGVGQFGGYFIHTFNEIYLPSLLRNIIFVMDSSGVKRREIPFEKTDGGQPLIPFSSISFTYQPLCFNDHILYIPQSINMQLGDDIIARSPVSIAIDTVNNSIKPTAMTFPHIIQSKDIGKNTIGGELGYSHYLNENQLIYSFHFDENLYVMSLTDGSIKRIPAKSRYIKEPKVLGHIPGDFNLTIKKRAELPCYGNILYDKYRNVYYRWAYPESELSPDDNYPDVWSFGRKSFSIIVLDKNFEVIGETRFPEFRYISTLCYVGKEGLYISDSHYKSPLYDESRLSFQCFKLTEKEK